MIPGVTASFTILDGFGDGLIIVFGLFPGFFSLIIIVNVFISWINPDPNNPVVQAIDGISEPLLMPFRRFVPSLGGLDFSPLLALICYQALGKIGQQFVAGMLRIV
jgi:YggT family protein